MTKMSGSQFDLSGKVALITGGNGGIGLGMAEAIARAGGDVCIWGTNAEKNAAALKRLEAHGGRATTMICDVSDELAVDACFQDTIREFGHVDGCFANAGVSGGRDAVPFMEITTESWRRITSINLDGAFFTLRAACRHMVERGEGGRLAGTASLAAISGAARNEHYAATKGGLISMLIGLSVEMARYQITANAILPGWIETEMTEKAIAWEKFASNVKPRIPMGRWGSPDDFGGIAAYIMSDASSFHTGDTFLIDGGYQKY
jgi:NAD(P)-dependent dehydrogenase (short-subunit alcohol dehydrogenase family)